MTTGAENPLYRRAQFLTSVQQLSQLPPDEGREVAFAGRSNAGKSSAINTLTGIQGLARTSKTPGRTQLINFFRLDETRMLVDLPGYGYAKVPVKIKQHWQAILEGYLSGRKALRGVVLVMDVRHPLTEFDEQMLAWCAHQGLPVHILLTKADKLNRGPAQAVLLGLRSELARRGLAATAQLFSALKRTGIDALQAQLDQWLEG